MGVMNVRPQTAAYRALNFVSGMLIELTPCPCLPAGRQCRARRIIQFLFSATLAQTFNKRCSVPIAIGIWCGTHLISQPTVFIAAGAAVGLFAVFYCFLKVLMVSSYRLGMVLFCYRKRTKPPRL